MFERSTAAGRPGHEIVERAARNVIDVGLGHGNSAFTPGRRVWSAETVDALHTAFVERPIPGRGVFLDKLYDQLAGAPRDAVQLAAELLYLNVLPLSNVYGRTKRNRINAVLSWLPDPPPIPEDLDAALGHGVLNGGVGFNVQVWAQLAFLVRFARHWFALPIADRDAALRDPWYFREQVDAVAPTIPSQRGVLLYLAFPAVFEAIAQAQHKKQIRRAFASRLDGPPGDLDQDLAVIRDRLQAESATPVHFYFSPWRDEWLPRKPSDRHAWLVRSEAKPIVDRWLAEGVVELPVGYLADLPSGVTLRDVEREIEASQPYRDYVARRQLAHDAHAMLSMAADDVLVTVAGDELWIGALTPTPPRYERGPVVADVIVRGVKWLPDAFDVAELPPAARALLSAAGNVVDLTEHVRLFAGLLAEAPGDHDDAVPVGVEDTSPDAYEEPALRMPDEAFAARLHLPLDDLVELAELVDDRKQVILSGPPGTGKTYVARELAAHLADAGEAVTDRVVVVQFHPSTTYEDFFEGYRPVIDQSDGPLRYDLLPGPLGELVSRAKQNPQWPYFMIIDEINRANIAKVFGELYFLLEYRDQGIYPLYRPKQPLTLPENVYFIGTMNTVDRSVVDVDAAMRRRFAFFELHPERSPVAFLLERWLAATGRDPERAALLAELNRRIDEYDLKIGPAYLMKKDADRPDGLARVWRYSILPLLLDRQHGRLTPEEVEEAFGLDAIRAAVAAAMAEPT